MGNYRVWGQFRTQRAHDRLAGEPMESVALETLVEELATEWQTRSKVGNRAMERCIKAGNVWHIGKNLYCTFQHVECRRHMEGSKTNSAFELGHHLRCDSLMFAQSRTAVDDAVAYCLRQ